MRTVLLLLLFPFHLIASEFLPSSFSVKIDQTYKSRLGPTKETHYNLDYKKPGYLRLESLKNKQLFVNNLEKSWQYRPSAIKGEKAQATVYSNQKTNSFADIFNSLENGLKSNDIYSVSKLSVGEYKLTFTKKGQANLDISEIVLHANEKAKQKLLSSRTNKMPQLRKSSISDEELTFTLKDIFQMDITYTSLKKVNLTFKNFDSSVQFQASHFAYDLPKNTKISHE